MKSKIILPNLILAACFIASIIIMWPGIISIDAYGQFLAAKQGIYSDHHPPMMGFIWQLLDRIYSGPGLLLLFHLIMLYSACLLFIYIFRNSRFKYWYAILPIVPNVLAYTPLITKDIGFTFSFLLTGAIIAYLSSEKINKYKWALINISILLLFYGTCVKYQARFILPIFTICLSFCVFNYKFNLKAVIGGIAVYLLIMQAMISFNNSLVPKTRQSHSWQLVKLYDLTAMSVALDKALFPEFIKQNPNYSFNRVKQLYSESEIDPLIFDQAPALKAGANQTERAILKEYWLQTVTEYPALYLKIRAKLWFHNLISTPSSKNNPAVFLSETKLFSKIFKNKYIFDLTDSVYNVVKVLLQFLWLSPLPFIYTFLALRTKSSSKAALLSFSLATITLLTILLFFSMAATARYIFICICLTHASHGFAYHCFKNKDN